ncbi:MAG: AMP-binding protein [Dehalococcoidia bacterium]|nr:AMP-binding protein [Dehalococcoidia bacterium]
MPEPLPDGSSPRLVRSIVRRLLWRPFRVAIVDDWRAWRGIQLTTASFVLADEIARRSEAPRVGLMLPTSGLFPAALLATWCLGRTAVPLNYLLKPAERDHILADAGLDLVVTAGPMLEQFGPLPPSVRTLLVDQVRYPRLPRFRRLPQEDPEATAVLIYTSGTSARPKGVELTFRNLAANVRQCAIGGDATSRDVFLGVLPQFHSFGLTVLTLLPLAVGAKVVYTARFVPRRIFELLRRHRPTGFVAIPAMYNALLGERGTGPADFASLRLLISGGEPLPAAVRERFEERFQRSINEGYGLTETGPVLNWTRPGEVNLGSVGPPLLWVEEQVVGADNQPLPPGAEGEICVRGPNVMKGYFGLPETTAAVFDADGFFHTGDLGVFDDEGRLTISGRLSDLIIVAGENVFPREIEDVLNRHPGIAEAAVVGVPDPGRGQVPVAFVQLAAGAGLDERRLRAYCREQLAGYKVPRRIVAVEEFPRSPTGKILKRLLPVEGLTRQAPSSGPRT